MATEGIFPNALQTITAKIVNADASALVTVYDPPTAGARIDNLCLLSDDTSARDIQFWITVSAVDYLLGTVSVPAAAGTTSSNIVKQVLADTNWGYWVYDAYGNRVFYLKDGAVLKAKSLTTVTAAKAVYITGLVGEF